MESQAAVLYPHICDPQNRIQDYPFQDAGLRLHYIQILPRGIADHVPLLLEWGVLDGARRPMWQFSAWHLTDQDCVDFVELEFATFFQLIEGSVSPARILRAASKPTQLGSIKDYVRLA
ncbi:hypothetical protein NDU88_005659 [Pleurodeles waltl]|uniref:Uncharacterized protein n=1 Tax=Pleurodeles waltl TaxID=8319 RepID=A0AAV7MDL6_PLEWA|nr:hypothetical protein NDU88_005659 [Pleurodeles waltl]